MSLPPDFIVRTQALLNDEWSDFENAISDQSPTSIRINASKIDSNNVNYTSVPWCKDGFYLQKRPQFTFDPIFHLGGYYVQEASSMFIAQALTQYLRSGIKILDLCAAPGGKSTLIQSLIDADSLLVSNEIIRSRANILAENMTKWGGVNSVVTNNSATDIGKLTYFFDVILIDAPCSGEGMFRKDEQAITEWSVANVALCQNRQREILQAIWSALKPGGILLYSTCTYNVEENEHNVQWICNELGTQTLPVDTKPAWGITPSFVEGIDAYRFLPHKLKGEGFFLSVMRKDDVDVQMGVRKKDRMPKALKSTLLAQYRDYIVHPSDFVFFDVKERSFALPATFEDDFIQISSRLNIMHSGICMGETKGKDFVPDHSLALSNSLNINAFTTFDLDWKTAISYLRKEALALPLDLPRGYVLLTYDGKPIGFVKNIGNRANNLYPHEWRIRSANIPQEEVRVVN